MIFPPFLYQRNRKVLSPSKIKNENYLFARHKPGTEWRDGDDYPEFSKLRSDQSFNWSAFSTPVWARFNDNKTYNSDHGVIGYSVATIRNCHEYDDTIPQGVFTVEHKPLLNNYSHCEFVDMKNATKIQKRDYRYLLKNNCKVEVLPYQRKNIFGLKDMLVMFYHNLLVYFTKAN